MFEERLTEAEVIARWTVFTVIPIVWALVRFIKGVLPGGRKDA